MFYSQLSPLLKKRFLVDASLKGFGGKLSRVEVGRQMKEDGAVNQAIRMVKIAWVICRAEAAKN